MHELNAQITYVLEFDCIKCGEAQEVYLSVPGAPSPYFCRHCGQTYHITLLSDGKVQITYTQILPDQS
jgi:hypothetical protein